ncbi:hypothetical protein JZ751_002717, partial [Albula glossodonta]
MSKPLALKALYCTHAGQVRGLSSKSNSLYYLTHAAPLKRLTAYQSGNGRLLEQILNNPKSPGSRTQPVGGKKVAIATAVCQPEPS